MAEHAGTEMPEPRPGELAAVEEALRTKKEGDYEFVPPLRYAPAVRRRPGLRIEETDVPVGRSIKLLGMTIDSGLELMQGLRRDVQTTLGDS